MKNLFILAAFAMLSMTASAQQSSAFENEENATVNTEATNMVNPLVYSDAYILSLKAPQQTASQSIMVNESYKQDSSYKSGKTLRTFGIVATSVGGAWVAFWGAAAISSAAQEDGDGWAGLGTAMATWYGVAGLPVLGAGVAMWLVGQHKMNKVKAASSGLGLAYQF